MSICTVFRRHQCRDLGWEFDHGICAENAPEQAKESIRKIVERSSFRSRNDYTFRKLKGQDFDDPAYFISELEALAKLNKDYMEERAKWPTITQDCSPEAIQKLKDSFAKEADNAG